MMNSVEMEHLFKWRDHKKVIMEKQQHIFLNGIAYDCALVSSDKKVFHAHQMVLSSASEFFHNILTDVPTAIEPTIHIPDVDSLVLDAMLTFIYTGEISIQSIYLASLLELCNFLDIKGTKGCSFDSVNTKMEPDGGGHRKSQLNSISESDEYFMLMNSDHLTEESDDNVAIDTEQDYDVEYLDEDNSLDIKDEPITSELSDCISFEIEKPNESDINSMDESNELTFASTSTAKRKRIINRPSNTKSQIHEALNEVNKGKTIHRLSLEYNLPRSTLYHHFRNNESLKKNYRSERKTALDNAVHSVLYERYSLKRASDKFKLPKTAIWREVRKYEQYQPSNKEVTEERQNAQREILSGKSLASISAKYGIPMTTLHRDKKRLSVEGKLPESFRVKDRTENSEYSQRLEMALQKCRQGMSQYQAARLFKIPKATMWRYAHALLKADQQQNEKLMEQKNEDQ